MKFLAIRTMMLLNGAIVARKLYKIRIFANTRVVASDPHCIRLDPDHDCFSVVGFGSVFLDERINKIQIRK